MRLRMREGRRGQVLCRCQRTDFPSGLNRAARDEVSPADLLNAPLVVAVLVRTPSESFWQRASKVDRESFRLNLAVVAAQPLQGFGGSELVCDRLQLDLLRSGPISRPVDERDISCLRRPMGVAFNAPRLPSWLRQVDSHPPLAGLPQGPPNTGPPHFTRARDLADLDTSRLNATRAKPTKPTNGSQSDGVAEGR
jgi:hypothetical protein